MPDELASEAGRCGKAARAASKRSICAWLRGSPGISDETKWLISRSAPLVAPCVSIAACRRARDSKPSRFMPVSRWIAQGLVRSATRGEGGPALELLFAADRGRESMLGIVGRIGPALEAVEHIDRGLRRQRPPRRDPLVEMGDEEDARARGPQRRRGFGDADPVSVGLDDGGATSGRGAARKVAPIVGERAEVDREARPGALAGAIGSASRSVLGFRISMPGCKTAARSAPSSPNARELHGRSLTPLSGRVGLRLVFAALAGEDRSGAVHRARRAMRRTIR